MPDTLFDAILVLLEQTQLFDSSTIEVWIERNVPLWMFEQWSKAAEHEKQTILNQAIALVLR